MLRLKALAVKFMVKMRLEQLLSNAFTIGAKILWLRDSNQSELGHYSKTLVIQLTKRLLG